MLRIVCAAVNMVPFASRVMSPNEQYVVACTSFSCVLLATPSRVPGEVTAQRRAGLH